jgi:PAS domain S-box-containing protein
MAGERKDHLNLEQQLAQAQARIAELEAALQRPADEPRPSAAYRDLEAAYRRISGILDSIAECCFALDRQYRFTAANERARAYLGQPEPLLGRIPWEIHPRLVDSPIRHVLQKAMVEQVPVHEEVASWLHPGRWLELYVYPSPQGLEVYARDITGRKQMEQDLREARERFGRLVDGNVIGVIVINEETITEANDIFLRMVGYSREDLVAGRIRWTDMTPPEYMQIVQKHLAELLATGASPPFEKEYIRKDGLRVPVLKGSSLLSRWPLQRICFVLDLTPLKQAEQALRQSEARLRAFFQQTAVGAGISDPATGRFLEVNPRLCQITGYTESELLHRTFADITHPEDRTADRERYARLVRGEDREYLAQKRYIRRDGRVVWVQVAVALVRDADRRVLQSVGTIEDISDRKLAEEAVRENQQRLQEVNQTLEQRVTERTAEAEQRAAQLRQLVIELSQTEQRERQRLARVLHDHLQQLLVAARFRVSLVHKQLQDSPAAPSMQQVGDLLGESIAVSRSLTMELSPPALQEGDLAQVLHWLAQWMQDTHGLHVQVRADGPVPLPAGDIRLLVFQAVRELLFNVVKHAGTNRATVEVMQGRQQVQVTVADEGRGFDPGRRSADSSGGGFGLFSLRQRLEILGGQMTIDSQPGRGTRIALAVPTSTPTEAADSATAQAQE